MIKKVVQVKPTKDFKIYVYFEDGAIRLYDVKPHIEQGGVFKQIEKFEDFLDKCTVLNNTVAWDLSGKFDPYHCIDIDPETLFSNGQATTDPLEEDVA